MGIRCARLDVDRILVGMVFFDLELLAQRLDDLAFADHPLPGEKLPQLQASLPLFDKGLLELLLCQEFGLNQHLTQSFFDSHGYKPTSK